MTSIKIAFGFIMAQALPAFSTDYDCVITPTVIVEVASPAGGLISEVMVSRGDIVEKGQIIARLDSQVEQTTVNLMRERAASKAEIEAQAARLKLAQSQRDRIEKLVERNVSPEGDLEEATAAVEVASRELAMAKMRNRIAELELDRSEKLLRQLDVVSPISGLVLERMRFEGEFADQDAAIARLAQLDPLNIETFLPVSVYPDLEIGMSAEIRPDDPIGGIYLGKVTVIDRVFDAASGTFGVRVEIDNDDLAIPAGHRCMITFGIDG